MLGASLKINGAFSNQSLTGGRFVVIDTADHTHYIGGEAIPSFRRIQGYLIQDPSASISKTNPVTTRGYGIPKHIAKRVASPTNPF